MVIAGGAIVGGVPDGIVPPAPLPLTIQLRSSDTDLCLGSTFEAGDVIDSSPTRFKARRR